MSRRRKEHRMMPENFKSGGVVRFMAEAEGYVMVRRPGCADFAVSKSDWESWEVCE